MKIKVESNVFKIPERLKEIDKGYFVLFDTETQKYEVHNLKNIGDTLCLNIPYEELDDRTVQLVHKTRIDNAKSIWQQMKARNEYLDRKKDERFRDYIDQTGRDIYRYLAPKAAIDNIPQDAYSTRFI